VDDVPCGVGRDGLNEQGGRVAGTPSLVPGLVSRRSSFGSPAVSAPDLSLIPSPAATSKLLADIHACCNAVTYNYSNAVTVMLFQ